jgi:hypothetical protein
MYEQSLAPELEIARLDTIEKFSNLLTAEITLAQHQDGFFEQKYWKDYLVSKYQYQNASNKFYVLLHEISK